jgi:hypothetical protein
MFEADGAAERHRDKQEEGGGPTKSGKISKKFGGRLSSRIEEKG